MNIFIALDRCGTRLCAPQSVAAWTQVQCNFFCLGAIVALCVSWMKFLSTSCQPSSWTYLFKQLLSAREIKNCLSKLIFGKLISRWMPAAIKFHFAASRLFKESKLLALPTETRWHGMKRQINGIPVPYEASLLSAQRDGSQTAASFLCVSALTVKFVHNFITERQPCEIMPPSNGITPNKWIRAVDDKNAENACWEIISIILIGIATIRHKQ